MDTQITIRDMPAAEEPFVGSCTHVGERAEWPAFPDRHHAFVSVEGKVVVIDLFWSRSCLTTDTEAQRVRDVGSIPPGKGRSD